MAQKFHLGKNGPAPCRAIKRACPVGGEEVHFNDRDAAQEAYEKSMGETHPAKAHSKNDVIQVLTEDIKGWSTRDEVRADLDMSLIEFKRLEESGLLPFKGPNNDLVLNRDLQAFKNLDNTNGFTRGEQKYQDVVVAFSQRPRGEDGKHPESVTVLVPNVKRLTDKKRMEIGRQVWEFSGKDVKTWDDTPDSEKLRWSNTHMGRYGDTDVKVKNGAVSWVTSRSVSSNHSIKNVKLIG